MCVYKLLYILSCCDICTSVVDAISYNASLVLYIAMVCIVVLCILCPSHAGHRSDLQNDHSVANTTSLLYLAHCVEPDSDQSSREWDRCSTVPV